MDKVNFKKELAHLYNPKNIEWRLVRVPTMNYGMVDSKGDSNSAPDYADAIEALYGASYAIKLLSRRTLGRDYVVPPLEGLWSSDDPAAFTQMDKEKYSWTMMIMQPDWITRARFAAQLNRKRLSVIFRHCHECGSSRMPRAVRCRSCTLALTMTRPRSSSSFTMNTCRNTI